MSTNLEGLNALVTGGSRGIGRAIATRMKADGAIVTITGTNAETLAAAASELGVNHIVADMADPAAVAALAREAAPVDILVNNAGITADGLFMRQKQVDWDRVLEVNLSAAVSLTRALIPAMLKSGFGRVINISSVVAQMGNAGQTNYVASKAAMEGFSRALGKEVARKNVTVNCIAPGFIETAMTEKLAEATRAQYQENIPARRFGTPEEVAAAAAFLASREAGYITGTVLHVNGGLYM